MHNVPKPIQEILKREQQSIGRDCKLLAFSRFSQGVDIIIYKVAPFDTSHNDALHEIRFAIRTEASGSGAVGGIVKSWFEKENK